MKLLSFILVLFACVNAFTIEEIVSIDTISNRFIDADGFVFFVNIKASPQYNSDIPFFIKGDSLYLIDGSSIVGITTRSFRSLKERIKIDSVKFGYVVLSKDWYDDDDGWEVEFRYSNPDNEIEQVYSDYYDDRMLHIKSLTGRSIKTESFMSSTVILHHHIDNDSLSVWNISNNRNLNNEELSLIKYKYLSEKRFLSKDKAGALIIKDGFGNVLKKSALHDVELLEIK